MQTATTKQEAPAVEVALSHDEYITLLVALKSWGAKYENLPGHTEEVTKVKDAICKGASKAWSDCPMGDPYKVTLVIGDWKSPTVRPGELAAEFLDF